MKAREIKTNIDDFRRDVILSILTAFPGRAVDDEDPSNDSFLIDGVPVKVEADRIIIGDDYSNSIPLKGSPVAGNPPQYRDIDSIISDFKLYVSVVKAEEKQIRKENMEYNTDISKRFIIDAFNAVKKDKRKSVEIKPGVFIEGGRSVNNWTDETVYDDMGNEVEDNEIYITFDDSTPPVILPNIKYLFDALKDMGYDFVESKNQNIVNMRIKESVLIPGTSIILEKGDRIYIKER